MDSFDESKKSLEEINKNVDIIVEKLKEIADERNDLKNRLMEEQKRNNQLEEENKQLRNICDK